MPGYLLHAGATVICSHGGQAMPTMSNPRVKVNGQPSTLQSAPYVIAGCPFTIPLSPVPCVTGMWLTGAVRVKSMGVPVLLQDSQAITVPNGVPLNVVVVQPRVKGM